MDPKIAQYIEGEEARKYRPYRDSSPGKFWTYGIGRNFEANPFSVDETRFLLENGPEDAFIDLLFKNDLQDAWDDATRVIGKDFPGWPPARQAAIISIIFNTGPAGFRGFKNMVIALRQGRWDVAAAELLDSVRSRETLKNSPRDEEEAQMIRSGAWPS